jgi:hypothetical protein
VSARQQPVEQFFQVSLLGLLASGFLALAFSGFLDTITIALTALGLAIRGLALTSPEATRWRMPSSLANALTLAYIGFYPLDYMYLSREFIPATVHLICFLSVVRILSSSTNRDYFFVKLLAFLEILAATLLSANISFFVFLLLFVVFGVATLCCSEIRRAGHRQKRIATPRLSFHRRLATLTALVTLAITLMTAGLFVLLPRTARAAFRSFVPEKYHITGFANEISLGQIGRIQQSTTPLVHVRIENVSRHLPLKWRGGALTQFDGRRWYNPPGENKRIRVEQGMGTLLADDDQRRQLETAQKLEYTVRIDALDADALFFAGIPEEIHINLRMLMRTPEGSYRTGLGTGYRAQYFARSFRPETARVPYTPTPLTPDQRTELLLLPQVDHRIIELARTLDPGGSVPERAKVFERYLRSQFTYTTDLLDRDVKDPLAHFLFDRKSGHCEYFASAMAVMLRAVHVPARVATGFQSGVYNPMTGWHVLRASDAHSWVEVWSPGEGWLTFDPTPPNNSPQGKPWSTLALYLDAAEMWWQRWVVDYDIEHQIYLASRFEHSARAWNRIASPDFGGLLPNVSKAVDTGKRMAPILGLLLIAVAVLWYLAPAAVESIRRFGHARKIRTRGAGASDAALLYLRMLSILRRRGYEKPAWLTPAEFARVLPPSSPMSNLVDEFTALYHELRYGDAAPVGPRMLELLDEMESAAKAKAG